MINIFSPFEGHLLEVLTNQLKGYIPQADISHLMSELKSELYSDITKENLLYIHSKTQNCKKCKNLVTGSAKLPAWNKTDPDLLIILNKPDIQKEEIQILTEALKEAGFKSLQVGVTYLYRCNSITKEVDKTILSNCNEYLFTEIQAMQPKLIMLLGSLSLETFFGKGIKLDTYRGQCSWLGPWTFLASFSTAYVMFSGGKILEDFKSDFKLAYSHIYGDTIDH